MELEIYRKKCVVCKKKQVARDLRMKKTKYKDICEEISCRKKYYHSTPKMRKKWREENA